jgi:hypothetical protein
MMLYHSTMHPGRRILKLLQTIAVVLSTLLFLAAMGMWGRSYWRIDEFAGERYSDDGDSTFYSLISHAGAFRVVLERAGPSMFEAGSVWKPPPDRTSFRSLAIRSRSLFAARTYAGFAFEHDRPPANLTASARAWSHTMISVPYWFIALLSLPLPLLALSRWRRERRIAREGLCPVCGYDLRASPDRCPECGAAREASATPS